MPEHQQEVSTHMTSGSRPRLAGAVASAREALMRVARPVLWTSRSEQGFRFGRRLVPSADGLGSPLPAPEKGRLEDYWDAHKEGPGIWKFRHYFDIYENHFSKFVGSEVHVVEIGIYSGGSLKMWRDYFGPQCH